MGKDVSAEPCTWGEERLLLLQSGMLIRGIALGQRGC